MLLENNAGMVSTILEHQMISLSENDSAIKKTVKVGILGFGTVGTGAISALIENRELITGRANIDIVLARIVDLDITTRRPVEVDPDILTTDANAVLDDPEIDIVVELIGGENPAKDFILRAIANGKSVVTANKALLAKHGREIFEAARKNDVQVRYEASVGGGIPVLRALEEGLSANRIDTMYGIINGTANFILTKMAAEGEEFGDVLKEAQQKGYAEADPTFDVEGIDAAHKLVLLAYLAYGRFFKLDDILIEGIGQITPQDIKYADELGYVIKPLSIAKLSRDQGSPAAGGAVELRVHPTLIKKTTMLAGVNGVFNAVYIKGNKVGPTLYYGAGAGDMPTGSAVVSDIIDLARKVASGSLSFESQSAFLSDDVDLMPTNLIRSRYYLRLLTMDRPGMLSKISGILGDNDISISSVIQKETTEGGHATVIMMSHLSREKDIQKALVEMEEAKVVESPVTIIRVE